MEFELPSGDDEIDSPCTLICTLDAGQEFCIGCGRTRAEIALWTGMSIDEKRRVLATAGGRRVKPA